MAAEKGLTSRFVIDSAGTHGFHEGDAADPRTRRVGRRHGLNVDSIARPVTDADFDSLFTRDKPVIFAYHGYPYLIHRLTYGRTNHANMHVRGFMEEGTTTTPFDMVVLNELDRFHLAIEAIDRVPGLSAKAARAKQHFRDKLTAHKLYVREHGEDMPEIEGWTWPYKRSAEAKSGA